MDWSVSIDIYCERLDAGFWAEPFNALTNLGFLAAAGFALAAECDAQRTGAAPDRPVRALALLAGVIGIGSFLFHTFARRWAVLADVLPITVFIYGYFLLAIHRFLSLALLPAIAATGLFLAAALLFDRAVPEHFLNGSGSYLPAMAAMAGIGLVLRARNHPASGGLAAATALFAVSLTLRSVDMALCPVWPSGTHYAWHLLNAALLYVLLRTALLNSGRERS